MKQKKTCSRELGILKAEEVQIKTVQSLQLQMRLKEDLLQKITDILKAEAAEAQPAATTAGDKKSISIPSTGKSGIIDF